MHACECVCDGPASERERERETHNEGCWRIALLKDLMCFQLAASCQKSRQTLNIDRGINTNTNKHTHLNMHTTRDALTGMLKAKTALIKFITGIQTSRIFN